MGDRAASNAAGGGGKGGTDPDEEWRTEFAAAWSQSNAERGTLRSQYAAVKAMVRSEVKGDPTLGQFDAAMSKIEKLHEKVQRPLEQLADGKVLLDLTDALVSSAKTENRDGPFPSEFVTALLSKFGVRASPLDDSNDSFSWSSLGGAASALFMTATGCQTMNGPMGLEVKERRHAVRRQSGRLGTTPVEPDKIALDQDERNDTDDNMATMFRLLRSHRRVKLEHLILNRQSFAQTVENIFALSFLVKDGRAEIDVVANGDHFVAPRNAPAAGLVASGEVFNSQFVFRFDTKDWQIMQRMVEPGEELMPHRSSYHGGEYKTTQSCAARGFSKLGSDMEHLKEDEFTEEDPLGSSNDEAVDMKSANLCSEDDTLKKRKRQRVARRLFAADS